MGHKQERFARSGALNDAQNVRKLNVGVDVLGCQSAIEFLDVGFNPSRFICSTK